MMPFSGAPKNKRKPLPSTETPDSVAPETDNALEDLEATISALSREDLMSLQDMVNARLEALDTEEPAEEESFASEDEEDDEDEQV